MLKISEYAQAKEQNYTDTQIAKAAGITIKKLEQLKSSWGIEMKKPDTTPIQITKEDYLREKKNNLTDHQICKKFDMGASTLVKKKKIWNVYKPDAWKSEVKKKEAKKPMPEHKENYEAEKDKTADTAPNITDEVRKADDLKQELEEWKSRALAAEEKAERQSKIDRDNGKAKTKVSDLENTLSQTKGKLHQLRNDYQIIKDRAEKAESELADMDDARNSTLLQKHVSQLTIMLHEAHKVNQ
ncbi:hypothetical protein D7Z54_14470 [Salibacterium salarium]|uniref:Uncharacterized protein n=1 Tax=Salibacterium salarium TaxID=284579 RepID=A0A3R9WSI5_9BACI|nr:hypothetical protein [Salibacterium salarium]RSL32652.1 hypothetical protein D7Z54_14470 [Salibacterium salarium]